MTTTYQGETKMKRYATVILFYSLLNALFSIILDNNLSVPWLC